MVYIAAPLPAPVEIELFTYSASQALLPNPVRANTLDMEVKRICASVQTDVLMSASRQLLRIAYKNDTTSAAALTITPAASQFIDGLSSYVLQPGDSVTLVNTSATNWSVQ